MPSKPLTIKIPEETFDIIDRAVALTPTKNRSAFLVNAARQAAEDLLLSHNRIVMDVDRFDAFVAFLDAPAELNPKLLKTLKRKAPWDE